MGRPRTELHTLLVGIIPKVYFQPPPNDQIEYPCVVYTRDDSDVRHAGNNPYSFTWRYQVTLIDRNPDSAYLEKLAALPLCEYNRNFKANNLNHDVFTLYF